MSDRESIEDVINLLQTRKINNMVCGLIFGEGESETAIFRFSGKANDCLSLISIMDFNLKVKFHKKFHNMNMFEEVKQQKKEG